MPQIFPCQNHTWRDLQPTRQVEGDWARSGSRILNIYINQAVYLDINSNYTICKISVSKYFICKGWVLAILCTKTMWKWTE